MEHRSPGREKEPGLQEPSSLGSALPGSGREGGSVPHMNVESRARRFCLFFVVFFQANQENKPSAGEKRLRLLLQGATTTNHPHLQHHPPKAGREVGNFGTALQARTGSDSLLSTSGSGVTAAGRRDLRGVDPDLPRSGVREFPEESRDSGTRKEGNRRSVSRL